MKAILSERGLDTNVFAHIFNLDIFKQFFLRYIQVCFFEHWIYWLLFLILCIISFYIAYKKLEFEKVLFPIFILISNLISMFSLYFCGKTFYVPDVFWIERNELQLTYMFLNYLVFLIMLNYCLKFIKINKVFYIIIILMLSFYSLFVFKQSNNFYKDWNRFYYFKKFLYMQEKIIRFYDLTNKTPIILNIEMCDLPFWKTKEVTIYNYDIKDYFNDYYKKIYTNTQLNDYYFSSDAIEQFYQAGGIFHEYELNNIYFSRLLDDNFVLNKPVKDKIIKNEFETYKCKFRCNN